jgi:hypothetical protein
MKTKQTFLVAGLSVVALLLTGCLAISVYPFYLEKDVSFQAALLGHWTKTTDNKDQWTFEKKGEKAYQLTYTDGEKKYVMDAHLFRLKEELFMDLFNPNGPEGIMPPPVPTHLLMRVFQVTPTLRMAALDYDWLSKVLEKDPTVVRHHLVVTDEKTQNAQIVLTADTPELQKFIGNNLKTEDAWKDPFDLKRD